MQGGWWELVRALGSSILILALRLLRVSLGNSYCFSGYIVILCDVRGRVLIIVVPLGPLSVRWFRRVAVEALHVHLVGAQDVLRGRASFLHAVLRIGLDESFDS